MARLACLAIILHASVIALSWPAQNKTDNEEVAALLQGLGTDFKASTKILLEQRKGGKGGKGGKGSSTVDHAIAKQSEQFEKDLMSVNTILRNQSWPAEHSKAYLANLKANRDALARIRDPKSKLSQKESYDIYKSVSQDMRIKVEMNLKGSNKAEAPGLVEVTVRTFENGKEASNYRVMSILAGWDGTPSRQEPFPELSSPTKKQFVPGGYYLWVLKQQEDTGDAIVCDKKYYSIGETGMAKMTIDLIVK